MNHSLRGEHQAARALEAEIRSLVQDGDLELGATLFLNRYGGEILAFLVVRLGSESEASEVYSTFTEHFWRGLPAFQWRSTLRSWGYTLARNAAYQWTQSRRRLKVTSPSRMPEGVARLRSRTAPYLETDIKDRMRELRKQLSVDDQTLLVLRIDKGLTWSELASVMSGQGEELTGDERRKCEARLRKRFSVVKAQLKALAEAEGLV